MVYEFVPHTGDVKFKARGVTMQEMFMESAMALKQVMIGDLKVEEKVEKKVKVGAFDKETLLHDFLEEFIYLLDAEDFVFNKITKFEYNEEALDIEATLIGDNSKHYEFSNDVKAITFNDMYVKKIKEGYECQVVLDV